MPCLHFVLLKGTEIHAGVKGSKGKRDENVVEHSLDDMPRGTSFAREMKSNFGCVLVLPVYKGITIVFSLF